MSMIKSVIFLLAIFVFIYGVIQHQNTYEATLAEVKNKEEQRTKDAMDIPFSASVTQTLGDMWEATYVQRY
jgi:hypothetical protein